MLTGGFLTPLVRSNSVPKEQWKLNLSAPPTTPPKLLKMNTCSGAPLVSSGWPYSASGNQWRGSTLQFPLFQFALPVELHQRRKALKQNVNLSSHLLPPDSSLGIIYVGFTSPGPTEQAPLWAVKDPCFSTRRSMSPALLCPTLLPFLLTGTFEQKKPLLGRGHGSRGLTGWVFGRRQSRWHTFPLNKHNNPTR